METLLKRRLACNEEKYPTRENEISRLFNRDKIFRINPHKTARTNEKTTRVRISSRLLLAKNIIQFNLSNVLLLASLLLLFNLKQRDHFGALAATNKQHDSSTAKGDGGGGGNTSKEKTIINSEFVNLNEILKHQQALVVECRRLEEQKLNELRQLIEFDRDNEQVHLANPVALKLPAVCLLLNGPPQLTAASGSCDKLKAATKPEEQKQAPLRLDLVNWLYDPEEILTAKSANGGDHFGNKTKRQIGGGGGGAAAAAAAAVAPQNELLASQWFDLNLITSEQQSPNQTLNLKINNNNNLKSNEMFLLQEEEEEEERKFKEHLDVMIKNEAFQEALQVDQAKIAPHLSPVILVPGLAGSRLQVRVQKQTRVNIICKREHDWQEMWLKLSAFLPVAIDCWIDNARLVLDETSGFTREPPGVESRVPDFGSIDSVRHLDLKSPKLTKYFDSIIERYLQLGYRANRNLFAAPYDFRLAPQQIQTSFFEPLRELIEQAATGVKKSSAAAALLFQAHESYQANGGQRKVTLVCHSMGCTHLLLFLRQQTSAWRQAHLRKVIAISSPWGGSIKALKALLVGEQFNIPLVSELKMRELARTFPAVAYLLPQVEIFGAPNKNQVNFNGQLLVETPERSYQVDQLETLLRDAGLEQHWQWFKQTTTPIRPLEPLADVSLDCIHSLNVPTTETIIFRNNNNNNNQSTAANELLFDGPYELIEGDGDGTVNHQSLLVCARWAAKYPARIKHKVILNTSHSGILSHKTTLDHITRDIATISSNSNINDNLL